MPTNVAARMTLAADPDSLQGAVAAGILGARPGRARDGRGVRTTARLRPRRRHELAREIRAAGGRVPGFGHPVHTPLDPRAERILELADERGVSGEHVRRARELRDAVAREWGKPLTMNVSLPIAAVLLDLGFPPALGQGRSRSSRARRACSPTSPRSASSRSASCSRAPRRSPSSTTP